MAKKPCYAICYCDCMYIAGYSNEFTALWYSFAIKDAATFENVLIAYTVRDILMSRYGYKLDVKELATR
ncbi:MAG TPA: hypothetical protein VKP88_07445 [Candidatus Paceibacterota bacterium]|nr:hypothetical protein [Candidatus Paceibacterota bacterium]